MAIEIRTEIIHTNTHVVTTAASGIAKMTLVAAVAVVVMVVVVVGINQMPNADLMNFGKEIDLVAMNVVEIKAARGHDRVVEIMIGVIATLAVVERLVQVVLRMSSDEDLPEADLKNFGIGITAISRPMTMTIEKRIEDAMRKDAIATATTEDVMKIMKKKLNLVGDQINDIVQINVVGMAAAVIAAVHAHVHARAHDLPLLHVRDWKNSEE